MGWSSSSTTGNMTIGELITYNALLVYFLDPIENLISIQPMMQSALIAGERLNEIFDLDVEKQNKKRINYLLKNYLVK